MTAEKPAYAQNSGYGNTSHLVTRKQILSITGIDDPDLTTLLKAVKPVQGNGHYELGSLIAHFNKNGYTDYSELLQQLWHPWRSTTYHEKESAKLPQDPMPASPADILSLPQTPDDANDSPSLPGLDYFILPQSNHAPRKKRNGESQPALAKYLAEMGETAMLSPEQHYGLFQAKCDAVANLYNDCLNIEVFRDDLRALLNRLEGNKSVAKSYEGQHRSLSESIAKLKGARRRNRLTGEMLREELGYLRLKPLVENTLEYLGDGPEDLETKALLEKHCSEINTLRKQAASANLRLVVSVAKKYRQTSIPLEDRIQEGNDGLMEAIDRFDHQRGIKFGTYAVWWIRQKISRAIANNEGMVRIPIDMRFWYGEHQKVYKTLGHALKRPPTTQEVADQMGLDTKTLEKRLQSFRSELSLDQPVGNDSDDSSVGQFIKDTTLPNPLEALKALKAPHSRETVNAALSTLTEREETVLRLRYGIGTRGKQDPDPMKLEDLGKRFGITRERIRQIEERAIRRLRNPLRSRKLKNLLD